MTILRVFASKRALVAASSLSAVGCGGALPILHPAHPLTEDTVSFATGVTSQIPLGSASSRITLGREATRVDTLVPRDRESDFLNGAVARATIAPGFGPWVGARAGLGQGFEAGLGYTGRTVRVDGRYARELNSFALSAGLGLSGVLLNPNDSNNGAIASGGEGRLQVRDVSVDSTGWGADVPLLAGLRSGVWDLYAGPRFGFELLRGDVPLGDVQGVTVPTGRVDASHLYAGGVLGVALRLGPFGVTLAVDALWHQARGTLKLPAEYGAPTSRRARHYDFTLAPAAALSTTF